MTWHAQAIPEDLTSFFQRFDEQIDDELAQQLQTRFAQTTHLIEHMHLFFSGSVYAQEQCIRTPQHLLNLVNEGEPAAINKARIQDFINKAKTKECTEFDRDLRRLRNQEMLRIIWRDFNRLASMQDTTYELSYLANQCIQAALDYHYASLGEQHGFPNNAQGHKQPFIVLGMGKLGADELNLSSDIDLIFAFPEKGETSGTSSISNQEFFSRLGKLIIQSLDATTAEGFVFRVDMRLRPYGQSGALVYNFDALEEYYLTQGREWERYAMVKAKVVAHNASDKDVSRLNALLKQFTYRKYIDFSVIDALRNLKKMIVQEVKRRRLEEDVKLGSGGIREIEFIAQVFQLIRGGRDHELQDRRILTILPELAKLNCLPEDLVAQLTDAYVFLRNTEHAIQGYNDAQTQKLPDSPYPQKVLAQVMGFNSWDAFYEQLNAHRTIVRSAFADLIADPQEKDNDESPQDEKSWQSLWQQNVSNEEALAQLDDAQHENATKSFALIEELHQWANASSMHSSSRERLDVFMPLLLARLANSEQPSETLQRISKLIKSVARRSAYLLLLIENPNALSQLLKLTEASPWIGDRLAEHPALLDELLDPSSLYHPPDKEELQDELHRNMLRIPEDDLEAQMEALRYFRSAHALRIAASEISGALPLMKVSDYLTWIAEVILDYVLRLAWQDMVKKHGYPDAEARELPRFVIVGYGKLGGIELSHGSDLDLVFIHDAKSNGASDGKRSLDNQTFFMRLGQKIIHFLTTTMSSGALYEVDMRLRPSGNSGMLVTSMTAFKKYQNESAWTWEHQALVRARVISGDSELTTRFNEVRKEILSQVRDLPKLRQEVIDMRIKMRDHLGSKKESESFHLKQDAGGIVDIEFMVQYGVLAWAHSHPSLVVFPDNIRILEAFAQANLLDTQEVDQLSEAYKAFRAVGHRLTLQQQPNLIEAGRLLDERRAVTRLWERLLESKTTE